MRRTARLVVLYVLEAIAALLALVILVGGALLWRLAEGPLDGEILRPTMVNALTDAVDGDAASIGGIQLRFDPAEASLIISVTNVRVTRGTGEVLLAAEQISTGLALDLLLTGRASPVSISAQGGSFSVVRAQDGRFVAGFGDPRGLSRQASSDLADTQRPGPTLGALTSELDPTGNGLFARLQRLDLREVDLRLIDEVSGLDWLIDGAGLDVDLQNNQVRARVDGDLVTSAGPAPLSLRLDSARNLDAVFAEFVVSDFVPAAAAPRRGALAALAGLEASFDARLVFDANVDDGLRTALIDIQASPGSYFSAGESYSFDESTVRLEYDAPSGAIELQSLNIQSDILQLDLAGRLYELGGFIGPVPTQARFEITSEAGRYNPAGVFPDAQVWTRAVAAGQIDTQARELIFEQLDLTLPYARGEMTGRFALEEFGERILPSIRLVGPIEGDISKQEVLRHWPVNFALGARDWIEESILDGRLSNAELRLDIPAAAIAERQLADEHLSLAFDFVEADVRYVSTMTPLLGLSGEAELRGNSLSLTGQQARIGDLVIETIFVELPRLNPKGAMARFGGMGTGELDAVLTLLSEPPLLLAESYGLEPGLFAGTGEMSFEIRRPMYRDVPAEDIGFQIDGRFEDVTAPTGVEGADLDGGIVTISATESGLTAQGTANLVGSQIEVGWFESFGLEDGEPSTRVLASGAMTGRGLDRLGLPARRFLDGVVDVSAELVGRGFDFTRVDVELDLVDATVVLPADVWDKPAGAEGRARLGLQIDESGALRLDPLVIEAEGIELVATASVGQDGRLLSADIDRLSSVGRLDVSLVADRPDGPDGALSMTLEGDYIDLGDLLTFTAPGGGAPIVTAPLILQADLERVIVRDVVFTDITMASLIGPEGINNISLMASTADAATGLQLDYAPDPENPATQLLSIRSDDAGSLPTAFGDFSNVTGGSLRLDAVTLSASQRGAMTGRVEVDAFTLERMPLLARILAAGSFEGLGGLLSGEGIVFERLETDFTWSEGTLGLENSRAIGPALGATWQGVVSFEESRIQLDGTLLPSYGANSILGGLPVIGELLTSRRGEGIFGVTFSVTGSFDETRVITNPLAAFAPGVFRRVFEGTDAERELDALRERYRQSQEETAPADDGEAEASDPGADNGAGR